MASGTATCDGTTCSFTCASGFLGCCGGCAPCSTPANAAPSCSGSSCDFTCLAGFHRCGNACADDSSVNTCGASCTSCPSVANGTPQCLASTCGATCNLGFEFYLGQCLAQPRWGDLSPTAPAPSPTGRTGHAMVYDAQRGRVVLFGGIGLITYNDTWEWDGTAWAQRTTTISPGPRSYPAMAFDAARARIVLFGGASDTTSGTGIAYYRDTWVFGP